VSSLFGFRGQNVGDLIERICRRIEWVKDCRNRRQDDADGLRLKEKYILIEGTKNEFPAESRDIGPSVKTRRELVTPGIAYRMGFVIF